MKKQTTIKAVAMFSGGLDSILAVKIMLDEGVEVHPIAFLTPFSGFTKSGRYMAPRRFSKELGMNLKVQFIGRQFVEHVKQPKHGYGKNMNPCIDCKILFFKKAKQYMEEIGAQFIITGEVLGERPMTQNKRSMKLIEIESNLKGEIVRPLSAQLLEPTIAEHKGWIKRETLLSIQGRSRKPQIKLAQEYNIVDYPTPAGGCLLTDPVFARRLQEALDYDEDSLREIAMLTFGRHFRLSGGAKVVVGRNEKENKKILALQTPSSMFLEVHTIPGPVAILLKGKDRIDREKAASICLRYSDCKENQAEVDYWKNSEKKSVIVKKCLDTELEEIRL